MPSLRDSGKIVGRSASVRQVARQCNLSFPLSLRQFISTSDCPFSRCNRLHIKVLTNPNIAIETMLNRMREVYSTAGIGVEVVSRENLNLPLLNDLDIGQCRRGETTAEQDDLFGNRNNVGDNDIAVYFVRSTVPPTNGCAAHPNGQPSAVVTGGATQWTLGHEVGHVLGLNHVDDNNRLMTGNGTANITNPPPDLVGTEINTMNESNLTTNC
jgi:hypothetical protein